MIKKVITSFLKLGTLLFTLGFVLSVLLQIFARFFLESAPAWTEETSRLFFVYSVAFSAGLAMKGKYFVSLEYFFNLFPAHVQRYLEVIITIFNCFLFGVLAIYAVQFVLLGLKEHSPSMGGSMSFAFFSMVILSITTFYYSFLELVSKRST